MKFVVTSFLFVLFSSSVFAQSLEPGLWQAKSSYKLNDVPMPGGDVQECISSVDAKDAKGTIAKELKKHGCELTKWVVKNKNLTASLKCDNNDFEATGTLKGTFTDKSYALTGEAEGLVQKMIPSEATLKLDGRWLKKCP